MNLNSPELSLNTRHLADAVSPSGEYAGNHVVILLALYNGAAFLGEQLASLEAQTHRNWSLLVSDDGSTDAGLGVLESFARAHPHRRITLLDGPRSGFAQNFLALVRVVDRAAPFVAFCDQDDVWMPDKLARSVAGLGGQAGPALYCGRTVVCGADLRAAGQSPLFQSPPDFRNALVQSIAGGNTMLLNRRALGLLKSSGRSAVDIVSHDWWAYQIVSGAGGNVVYDPVPLVRYRQHSGNLVGANGAWPARLTRVVRLLRGEMRGWMDVNLSALNAAAPLLTEGNRQTLSAITTLRCASPWGRLAAVTRLGLYRQTRYGQVALKIAALLNKL